MTQDWDLIIKWDGEAEAFNGPWANTSKSNVSEITALKQRVAQLGEENAILKIAEAYFTKKHR